MKKTIPLILALLCTPLMHAQERVEYVDDESCGCELVFIDGIQTTQEGDRFGFKREDGTVIVPNKYMFVDKFHGDYCRVFMDYDHCGLINRDGVEVIPCLYSEVVYPTDGMIRVLQDSLYGFFDTLGQPRIPFRYRAASTFSEGLAVVAVDIDSTLVAYGYIDYDGNTVIPPMYEYAYPFFEGVAVVKNYERYGMIDKKNKEVLTIKYEIVTSMSEGVFFAGDEYGMALFDRSFKPITKPLYTQIIGMSDHRILAKRDGRYSFLDLKGKEITSYQFDEASLFNHGRAGVCVKGKWGIIDTHGKVILPLEYDHHGIRAEVYSYHDGLALIEKDSLFGYADLYGNIVIPPKYPNAYHFGNGLAPVLSNWWGYIDTKGNMVIPPAFDLAGPFAYGRAEVVYRGEEYHINTEGRCVKNCKTAPKTWKP